MSEFDQAKYVAKYQKENIQRVVIKLNKIHDADIIEHINAQPNKQGYLKDLIREDIKNTKRNTMKLKGAWYIPSVCAVGYVVQTEDGRVMGFHSSPARHIAEDDLVYNFPALTALPESVKRNMMNDESKVPSYVLRMYGIEIIEEERK